MEIEQLNGIFFSIRILHLICEILSFNIDK